MTKKLLIHICFLLPFVLTIFNAQVIISVLIYDAYAQIMAYANLALLAFGIIALSLNHGDLSRTSRLWIIFFFLYFTFATLASGINNNPFNFAISIIPVFYVVGFYFYLSYRENRILFEKVAVISLIIVCLINIYWFNINFDIDKGGVYKYVVDRAGGVYGDANNMALTSVIAIIFISKIIHSKKRIYNYLKILLFLAMFYSLFITFSNTGFIVFIISILLLNHQFYSGIRLILGIIFIPILYLLLLNLNLITASINLVGQQRDKINNIVNIISFNFDKVDDSSRNKLLGNLINYISENPILGNGIDFAVSQQAHNTILGVWADAGLFVFLFFLWMFFIFFIRAIKSSNETKFIVLPLLISMCIFMLSLQSVINQPYLIAFFIYIGYKIDFDLECKIDLD